MLKREEQEGVCLRNWDWGSQKIRIRVEEIIRVDEEKGIVKPDHSYVLPHNIVNEYMALKIIDQMPILCYWSIVPPYIL